MAFSLSMFCRSCHIAILAAFLTVSSVCLNSQGAVLCHQALNTSPVPISLQTDLIREKIETLLERSHDQRIDVEINELLIKEVSPILESIGKLLRENTKETTSILKTNTATLTLRKLQSAGKHLNKLGALASEDKGLMMSLLKLLPFLKDRLLSKAETSWGKDHFALINLEKTLTEENQILIDLDIKLSEEISRLTESMEILKNLSAEYQNREWILIDLQKNNPSEKIKTQITDIQELQRLISNKVQNLNEVTAVSIVTQTRVNSILDHNKQVQSSLFKLLKVDMPMIASMAKRDLKLDPIAPPPAPKPDSTVTPSKSEDLKDPAKTKFTGVEIDFDSTNLNLKAFTAVSSNVGNSSTYSLKYFDDLIEKVDNVYQLAAIKLLVKKGSEALFKNKSMVLSIQNEFQFRFLEVLCKHIGGWSDYGLHHFGDIVRDSVQSTYSIEVLKILAPRSSKTLYTNKKLITEIKTDLQFKALKAVSKYVSDSSDYGLNYFHSLIIGVSNPNQIAAIYEAAPKGSSTLYQSIDMILKIP